MAGAQRQADGFDALGYRYEFDVFAPAEHLTLAVHDQYAPAAAWLGDARVDRDPAHVTFVRNPTMDFSEAGTTADHAYWLSAVGVRGGDLGSVDAVSSGFGVGDPTASPTARGSGSLDGGTFGSLAYTSQARSWGPVPSAPRADALSVRARDIGTVTVHPDRARLTCAARLSVDTDGPLRVVFAGCGRVESFSAAGRFVRVGGGCARASGFRRAAVRVRRSGGARIAFTRSVRRRVRVDVLRHSRGRRALPTRVVVRFGLRSRSFTWWARGVPPGFYTVRLRVRAAGSRVDERRSVVERTSSRFVRRRAYVRRPDCRLLSRFALNAPVFGGVTARRLVVRYRLARKARVRVDLVRGGKAVRRLAKLRRVRAGRTRTLRVRPRNLHRGAYRIRLTIRRPGAKPRRIALTSRKL